MNGIELRRMLGFTTQTFMNQLVSGELTSEEAVIWASDKGFAWIEVRDRNVSMDKKQLTHLKEIE